LTYPLPDLKGELKPKRKKAGVARAAPPAGRPTVKARRAACIASR
jgi:hypothetical protein